jgi:hypothetical protein
MAAISARMINLAMRPFALLAVLVLWALIGVRPTHGLIEG